MGRLSRQAPWGKWLTSLLLASALTPVAGQATQPSPTPSNALVTDESRTLYALGFTFAASLSGFNLSEAELALVEQGMRDALLGRPKAVSDPNALRPAIQALAQRRAEAAAAAERQASRDFVEKVAADPSAIRTSSGLIYSEIKAGTGDQPSPRDRVKVHYSGTLVDGTVFDSSRERGEPTSLALNEVIPCWTEALPRMRVGARAKILCPPDLAYGDRGVPPLIKPGATLLFDLELLSIVK